MLCEIPWILGNEDAIRSHPGWLPIRARVQTVPIIVNSFISWFFIIKCFQLLTCLFFSFRSYVEDIFYLFLGANPTVNLVIGR